MLRINVDSRVIATVAAIVTFAAWTVNVIMAAELDKLTTDIGRFQTFISEIENRRNLDYSISSIKLSLSKLAAKQMLGNDVDENHILRESFRKIEEISFNAEFANQIYKHSSELLKISNKVKLEPAALGALQKIYSDIEINYMKIQEVRTSAIRELELINNPMGSGNKIAEISRKRLNEIDQYYFNITKLQIQLLGISNEVSRAVEVKRSKYLSYQRYLHVIYIILIVIASLLGILLKFKPSKA